MADMPMAKSANSFVTLATASRWLRELCDFMGGARFAQHLLYVRGDFTITKYVFVSPLGDGIAVCGRGSGRGVGKRRKRLYIQSSFLLPLLRSPQATIPPFTSSLHPLMLRDVVSNR